ncbi:hypothetical protein JKP88DRAFT_199693 [Tribonema minus]|uniref:Multicopper oxidase n=1 Tax=Tribonema minus TaxID=303371 RepID=A0A835YUJ5_9STRA|nr:hypothetical protein JKP88DRAFT_199693 [Tribonema minus]
MLIPPELLDSKVTIPFEQVKVLTKGNRNPFRIFYREKDDTLFIGDIGQGDGGTTERIFKAPGISKIAAAPKAKPYNWGWPCIEGLYQNSMFVGTDEYKLYDALSEVQRQEYLQAEYGDDNVCGPVYTAATDYTNGDLPSKYADAMWKPPIFEYRTGALDPNHSGVCMGDTSAAVTSVHVYDGLDLPEALQGKLIFSDKIIGCMWYFDTDKDGQPTNLNSPHALMTASNIIDMQEGPDGALYLVHFDDQINRITRMYAAGMGPAKGVDTPPPTNAPTAAPFAAPEVPVAETCFAPDNMPELEWTEQADGSFSGTLELSAVEMVKGGGTIVTRGFNGMVPGPVIRMQACNTYKLRLVNDQAGWPAGLNADQIGGVNGFHDPTVTNLHLHGLHISGMAPGDSMDTLLEAGEMNVYTYTIPCEHASGTFWYHPHGHGSTALQADGGAAGMLIVEGAPRESAKFPPAYNAMPEQLLVVQDINTDLLGRLAGYSGDSLFSKSPMMKPFTMVNGCDPADAPADVALAAGQWTKLRMLNVGTQYNSVLSIVPAVPAADPCDVQLLAKDGVWLSDAPRVITPLDNAINFKLPANALSLFFSLSSRVDVAIRCPAAGMHKIVQQRINDPSCLPGCLKDTYQHPTIATITVGAAAGAPAPALPKLKPCRPGYLMDIVPTAATEQVDLTIRVDGFSVNNLPGALYTGVADAAPMTTMTLGQPYQWVIDGSANHPFHAHVNHMMLSVDIQPWDQVQANWHMPGDWLDSISVQGQAPVLIRPDHFSGPMVMHCHIAAHADMGLMGFSTIEGKDVVAEDWGTC